jgi:hypothetical protein
MSDLDADLEMPKQHPDKWSIPPVHFGNIDDALERVARQLPVVDRDMIYLWELERHEKAYLLISLAGMMMFALAVMI